MWPVQTLTLLLCLTDDEQLFAQRFPEQDDTVVEIQVEQANECASEACNADPYGISEKEEKEA